MHVSFVNLPFPSFFLLASKIGDNVALLDYINEGNYIGIYRKSKQVNPTPPIKRDKSKKISRKPDGKK